MRRLLLAVVAVSVLAVVAAACGGKGHSAAPGHGQVFFADVVGTDYASGQPSLRAHRIEARPSLPASDPAVDASSDYTASPMPQGCRVRRFDTGAATAPDANGGTVIYSGYNSSTTLSVLAGSTNLVATTVPISCAVGSAGRYGCTFAGGHAVADVTFPMVPRYVVNASDPSQVLATIPDWTFGDAGCLPRLVANPQDPGGNTTRLEVCEQMPTMGTSQISEEIAGGAAYAATSATIGFGGNFPRAFFLSSVKSGATTITGIDTVTGGLNLDLADGAIDAASSFRVDFQCFVTTAGNCGGNLAELELESATTPKTAFAESAIDGELDCFLPLASTTSSYTITVTPAQMTAFLGGRTGGSVRLELMNLAPSPEHAGSHEVLFGAGAGLFGFENE